MFKVSGIAIAVALVLSPGFASATPIVGQGLPTDNVHLNGGTVIDFESTGVYNGPSLTLSGVTFTGDTGIEVDSEYAGDFNTRGTYNLTNHGDGPSLFRFEFAVPVKAFAFLWGAADAFWVLSAYNGATLLETLNVTPTHGSNLGDYVGIANSAGITHAELSLGDGFDHVFLDNFTFSVEGASVPEPAAIALLGIGLAGLGFSRRRNPA